MAPPVLGTRPIIASKLTAQADVTLGPRIFSSCPMDPHSSYTWFTDIWNFTIVPYVISAVRQRKLTTAPQWSDPLIWVKESWPWATPCDLLPIRVEDVSSDTSLAVSDNSTTVTTQSSDPLLNMLLRLQEAAAMNYESDASHDDAFELSLDRALGDLA
uniref:CortBP2/NAV1-like AAA+ ATPase lid domain-containing protein n=1 Tax=Ciona savignyi TaxID=51511 RepID=H2Z0X5_CIOSA